MVIEVRFLLARGFFPRAFQHESDLARALARQIESESRATSFPVCELAPIIHTELIGVHCELAKEGERAANFFTWPPSGQLEKAREI